MLHCDLRVRWPVAGDLRFRVAISEPEYPSFCGISSDSAPSTRKSLAIAIVRFWRAKSPDPPILAFLEKKSTDAPKKARISLSAEPLKSLEKKGKRTKKQGEPQNERSKENEESKDWRVREGNPVKHRLKKFPSGTGIIGAPNLGSAEGGHPDLFRFVFCYLPICSDLFSEQIRTNQNKSGKPLSADPFCKFPWDHQENVMLQKECWGWCYGSFQAPLSPLDPGEWNRPLTWVHRRRSDTAANANANSDAHHLERRKLTNQFSGAPLVN